MKDKFYCLFLILVGIISVEAQFSRTDTLTERKLTELARLVEPIYRKPSKEELKAVEPSRELFKKYAQILRQNDTGLTKLISDKKCSDNTKVIVVTDDCLKYTMPGAGSSYSFRINNYRIPRLADLTFTDNSFQASGNFLHGIFVNIGNVSIENVTLQTKGITYLAEFQPEIDYEKAKQLDQQLVEGIRHGDFLYRRGLYIVENTTFALRSIAYNGDYYRSIAGITYNELNFDKRRDIIVIFRIVEKDEAENVTILWKKLQEKESPKIKKDDERTVRPKNIY
jgi:hypothetical protein